MCTILQPSVNTGFCHKYSLQNSGLDSVLWLQEAPDTGFTAAILKMFWAFVIASVTFKESSKDQDWCGGNCILPCEKTVPWELKGLVTAVYWQKNLKVSTFASGQIETAAFSSFSLFCFVLLLLFLYLPMNSELLLKPSFITTNCYWQRAFWLPTGPSCMQPLTAVLAVAPGWPGSCLG